MEESKYTLVNGFLTICDGVKKIPKAAFKNRDDIIEVFFPNSMRTIGKYAFCSCINLKHVEANAKLKVIEQGAFQNCFKLLSSPIPKKVEYIGKSAFNCCYMMENPIVIPRNIRKLEESIFFNCKAIPSIVLPRKLKKIGKLVFFGCSNVSSFTLPETVTEI